jgi:hypothetical protein
MNVLSNSHHQGIGYDKLPIQINGFEKYATGLTKRTTVDDIKFAMLSVSDSNFNPDMLNEFGIFENWQGNERLLDGKIKIYKLIRLWQSLPGDQLSQVKFMIKKRKLQSYPAAQSTKIQQKMANQDNNLFEQENPRSKTPVSKRYAFCTLSPAMQKTWNEEKIKRKSSYIQRQLNKAATKFSHVEAGYESSSSILSTNSPLCSSYESDSSSSDIDDDLNSDRQRQHKRYASIKRFNRSKKSNITQTQQIKKEFIDLVNKQNEIIDKQLNKITNLEKSKKNRVVDLVEKLRSRSLETRKTPKTKSVLKQNDFHISEQDVSEAFPVENVKEYAKLCKDYFQVEHSLSNKLNKIEQLKVQLNEIQENSCLSSSSLASLSTASNLNKSIKKTNKKLLNSMDTNKIQNEKLSDLSSALTRIDDVITLKSKFIQSLEDELQRLEQESATDVKEIKIYKEVDLNNNFHSNLTYVPLNVTETKKSLAYTSSSSTSSSSSVFTSISSVSNSQARNGFDNINNQSQIMNNRSKNFTFVDNESDTGISSANSEDFNTQQLETLV